MQTARQDALLVLNMNFVLIYLTVSFLASRGHYGGRFLLLSCLFPYGLCGEYRSLHRNAIYEERSRNRRKREWESGRKIKNQKSKEDGLESHQVPHFIFYYFFGFLTLTYVSLILKRDFEIG